MAIQEEQQRINDSTLRELTAIVEAHNRNVRDQEVKLLREELENLRHELGMKEKILNVREASNEILLTKYYQAFGLCQGQVEAVDNQIIQLKSFTEENKRKKQQAKMFFRYSKQNWEKSEEKIKANIENLKILIDDLHATLERNGIQNDLIEVSDYEYDGFDVDWNEYLYRPDEYESDARFYDEVDIKPDIMVTRICNADFQRDEVLWRQAELEWEREYAEREQNGSNEEADQDNLDSNEEAQLDDDEIQDSEDQQADEQIESTDSEQDTPMASDEVESNNQQIDFEQDVPMALNEVVSNDQPIDTEQDVQTSSDEVLQVADNDQPQEQNWCDMLDDETSELDQESQPIQPVVDIDGVDSESACISEEQPQKAPSDSNAESPNKLLESEKPQQPQQVSITEEQPQQASPVRKSVSVIEEQPQQASIIEEQSQQASSGSNAESPNKLLESEKPIEAEVPQRIKLDPFVHGYVEKPKKRRQKKRKSKPKFSNFVSFGGI